MQDTLKALSDLKQNLAEDSGQRNRRIPNMWSMSDRIAQYDMADLKNNLGGFVDLNWYCAPVI